jgi:hypothetical protein
MSKLIAENVDERGVLKIRSLVAKYGLKETLEAMFLEVCDDWTTVRKASRITMKPKKNIHAKLGRLVGLA